MTTTRRARRARLLAATLAVLLLATAACGSRAETDEAGDQGLDAPTDEGGGGEDAGSGEVPTPESEELGTIANPCSDDALEGETPADVPGVTDDTIRIGVISDRENPAVPLPTVGIEEAVKGFVEFCNAAGGINGRQIELQTYDSEISRTEEVTSAACRDDLFALVGSGSVQDQQGVTTREECGLPEVAAYSATSTRAESEDFFQPVVGTLSQYFNVGPCKYIAEQHPEAVKKAAIVYTDLPTASVRGAQIRDSCSAEAGIEYVVDAAQPFGDTDWTSLVSEMKQKDVKYFTMVSSSSETIGLLEEIQTQGLELEVIDLGQQYYDPAIAAASTTEGAHVLTNTVPFTEMEETPMLGLYDEWVREAGAGDDKITSLGAQAFSAGLLWATAADAAGADLTRETLVSELEGITEWDGGGIQMTANPGENQHNECFLYMQIEGGEFVREFPDEGFECNPDDVIESDESYGT
ncbi:ABC transporter substrate-binding protein [Iamia majanohamensis]|uniref:ABC transporter substrate-binding protein n=1 Tax=Iamia majanohamensis TaxID=467976 RepID=A0AAF0BT14_9ACTN|nr:ABC transporter substrate-binding protein [Iamia majanohamensis]WCO66157.1 ABC transporter substrate-binding protein [Iamia majanohamensis]